MENREIITEKVQKYASNFPDLATCRQIFRKLQLPLIPTLESISGPDQLLAAISFLAAEYRASNFLVRLNQSTSTNYQALISLARPLEELTYQYQKEDAILDALVDIRPLGKNLRPSNFFRLLVEQGGSVELVLDNVQSKVLVNSLLAAHQQAWQLLNLQQKSYDELTACYRPNPGAVDLEQQQVLVKMVGQIALELMQLKVGGKIQVEFLQVWENKKLISYPLRIFALSGGEN